MELNGRRFGTSDDGAPMMCNLICQSMDRHAHLDYCRTDPKQSCAGSDHEHITTHLAPNPDQPKDWISHKLYWRRSGMQFTPLVEISGIYFVILGFRGKSTFSHSLLATPLIFSRPLLT